MEAGVPLGFDADGLVPVVVQDAFSGEVLMLAYADREAVRRTLDEGRAWYFSRARRTLWRKGESSGHAQDVVEVRCDCDGDALLYRVRAHGPACHTGERSCFHRLLGAPGGDGTGRTAGPWVLDELAHLLRVRRRELPEGSYAASLFRAGRERIAQKVGEEAVEVVVAAAGRAQGGLVGEAADLVFHLLVLLVDAGVDPREVWGELAKRRAAGRPGEAFF